MSTQLFSLSHSFISGDDIISHMASMSVQWHIIIDLWSFTFTNSNSVKNPLKVSSYSSTMVENLQKCNCKWTRYKYSFYLSKLSYMFNVIVGWYHRKYINRTLILEASKHNFYRVISRTKLVQKVFRLIYAETIKK